MDNLPKLKLKLATCDESEIIGLHLFKWEHFSIEDDE